MCGGGGSSPPAPDPLAEAQAQILIEEERAKREAAARALELERQAQQAEQDRARYLANLDSAFQGALNRGTSAISQRGLDPTLYEPNLRTELESIRASVPFLDPNPGSYFGSNIADVVLDRARDVQRRNFTNTISEFASPGFATELFPGTADDAVLQAILQEQFEPANLQLERARSRGNLTQSGFDAALSALQGQRSAGEARLQDIGGGVLSGYRDQLRDVAESGFGRAGSFELGQTFDPSSVRGQIETLTGELQGRLPGDIRNALGGEQLFNIEDLISRGGIAQGAQNPTPALIDAFVKREDERTKKRGLGQQGVF